MKKIFSNYIDNLQVQITDNLEQLDKSVQFTKDYWKRDEGGHGLSKIIENGNVFEKAGVNVSKVHGLLPKSMMEYLEVKEAEFFACGLSLVIHPLSPMVPTVHANWRYFEIYDDNTIKDQWFGGGIDLSPYYIFEEDVVHFHTICKQVCDKHNSTYYDIFKDKCDNYFWNTHRNEARGVGGLFFDYCRPDKNMDINNWFSFISDLGNSFLKSYIPIVKKRKDITYNKQQRKWQEIRRGRYVEFNLLHDKGTLFGLKTNGRIESILMSLPPKVQWKYNYSPDPESEEEKLIKILKKPKSWI